ncbi:1387_t:CDS:2 [Ambispora gerdemannii]|uniref:1387_t:CDS:1 n=1 Tax=Ambispora gerdemannii TaxID=144530 RepID=A0A9N9GGZ4_9GLOM|nr:1387_t:CDS:2 [Ambispora gerdemannii]
MILKRIFACSFSYSIQSRHLFLARDYLKFASCYQSIRKRPFHSTPIQRANIKSKPDCQKQEGSKSDPISGVETSSLLHSEQEYQAATDDLVDQNDEKLLADTMPKVAKGLNNQQQQPILLQSSLSEDTDGEFKDEKEKPSDFEKYVLLDNKKIKVKVIIRQVMKDFGKFEGDTGSPEVQVAVLTVRILKLHQHIKKVRKDNLRYRRLLKMVQKRQNVLKYLKEEDSDRYLTCLKRLGLDQKIIEGQIVM